MLCHAPDYTTLSFPRRSTSSLWNWSHNPTPISTLDLSDFFIYWIHFCKIKSLQNYGTSHLHKCKDELCSVCYYHSIKSSFCLDRLHKNVKSLVSKRSQVLHPPFPCVLISSLIRNTSTSTNDSLRLQQWKGLASSPANILRRVASAH